MLKGFGFINFSTRKDALKAIGEMNGKSINKRKIEVTLAQQKENYKKDEENRKIEKEFTVKENYDKPIDKSKTFNKPLLNDPKRTLFIRNLGFQTNEDSLKQFFMKYGSVVYVKIVKNKETNTSRGTAFVCFKNENDVTKLLNLFKQCEDNRDTINPFELEGRNIKLLSAISKEDAKEVESENKRRLKEDPRKRHLIYYGLNNIHETSEEDKIKRETIIGLKKINFKKNPNYHVSNTRLTIRNLEKSTNEDYLKELLKDNINKFTESLNENDKKIYNKIKKIKQIKILRDKNFMGKDNLPKSKCCAFVEVCDERLGKYLIDTLSNFKLSKKNPNKGLILDFALDDIRKVNKRKNKLKRIRNKDKTNEESEIKDTQITSKDEKKNNNQEKIEDINDINKLLEIYYKTVSRGKKQRIKKKLKNLGYTKNLEKPNQLEPNITKPKENVNFTAIKVETNNTNLNKKSKKEIKSQKKEKNNFLKRKKNREEYQSDDDLDISGYISQIKNKIN